MANFDTSKAFKWSAKISHMSTAARTSWKILSPPTERAELKLDTLFTDVEGERMREGYIPKDMDDRWFVFFEGGWLNFYRSWTGVQVYALRLDGSPNGVRVVDGWVSRKADEYRSQGIEHDRNDLIKIIEVLFQDVPQMPTNHP